jgi:hypothetical protein
MARLQGQTNFASESGVRPMLEPVVGRLDGHLTRDQLERVLDGIGEQLRRRELAPVLLDCSAMDGYDLDARHAFVDWNKQWKAHVTRVAIVTHNRLYHVVIATMSLASGQAMKGFGEYDDALAWARVGALSR